MKPVFIGLGSNLADPKLQLQQAIIALKALPKTLWLAVSSFYQTTPVGYLDQPDFLNAVAALQTVLPPIQLLDELQRIEQDQGRVRLGRNGPITLDLDIFLYGDSHINTERLVIPHPRMQERSFVQDPLKEVRAMLMKDDMLTGV